MSLPCPGSNDIREWVRAAGNSKYVTPRMLWWGWAAMVFGLIALGMCSMAHASPSCMTYTEARATWPTKYLHWRGEHCWSYAGAASASRERAGHHERQHV
jgi:hypothetical protein